jgi:hypothetical protein
MQLDEPVDCTPGGDLLLLYKILHLLFFPLVRILCVLHLESRKNYQHGLDVGLQEFQFLWPRGCLTNPLRTLSLCFRVIGQTPCLISHNNFVKEIFVCIGHRDNILARCDYLPFAQLSRSVEQNVHTTFSFPNPLSGSEELRSWGCSKILISFLMWCDGHFWRN